jgi:hypothetical protein
MEAGRATAYAEAYTAGIGEGMGRAAKMRVDTLRARRKP